MEQESRAVRLNKAHSLLRVALLTATVSGAPAFADPPERIEFSDGNGINILNGQGFSFPDTANSFAIGTLRYDRTVSSNILNRYPSIYDYNVWFEPNYYVELRQDSGPYQYWSEPKRFQRVGSTNTYQSTDGDGSYFLRIGVNVLEYYQRGGNITTYDNYAGNQLTSGSNWRIKSIRKPNGEIVKFTARLHDNGSGVSPRYTEAGLQSISSSFGYIIQFEFASDIDATGVNPPAGYKNVVAVNGYNQAHEICLDGAFHCGIIAKRPRVNFSTTSTSSSGSLTATNALGQTSSFSWDQTGPGVGFKTYHVRFPRGYAAGSDDIAVRIRNNSQDLNVGTVYDLTIGGIETWSYFGGTVTAPDASKQIYGSTFVKTTAPTISRITSIKDQLGNITSFHHDAGYRLDEITTPEGNKLKITWDSLGRRTELRRISRTAGSPADIVETRSYPATCANLVVCGLPLQIVDGQQKVSEFTYDPVHGGVLTESLPVDSRGIRPVRRYQYAQRSALILGAGGSVQANPPIWLISSMRQCTDTATDITNNTCVGGSADEVVTTFEYSNSGSPHNLNLLGIAVSSATGTRVTCYGYDALGRVISETGPAANRSTCQ